MNKYTDKHSGKSYSQKQIEYQLKKAKKEKKEEFIEDYGRLFCYKCRDEGIPEKNMQDMERALIDYSHNLSIAKCKWEGEIEKIWDKDNAEFLCRHHHKIKDGLMLYFK